MTGTAEGLLGDYLALSWHLTPLGSGSKQPLLNDWPTKATTDSDEIASWAARWPGHNLAVVLEPSGLAVVDIDSAEGEAELQRVLEGAELPPTLEAHTGRGRHLYFRDPGKLTKSARDGLDLQVGRAYVIVPPSVHPDGKAYRWAPDRDPGSMAVAPMPQALVRYFAKRSARAGKTANGPIPEGERNVTLTSIAGRLRARGRDRDQIATELAAANARRCTPPLEGAEVEAIATSIATYEAGEGKEVDRLIAIGRAEYELAVDEQNEPIAIALEGPRVALPFRDDRRGLDAELRACWVDTTGCAPGQTALQTAVLTLETYARRASPRSVDLRVARPRPETVVIDLGRPDGACVIVEPGGWREVERFPEPVVFRRTALTLPLPQPEAGGRLEDLRDLLNVEDEDWGLLQAWMIATLLADLPHPILLLAGEQGTGKSTAAKLIGQLLDPSSAPLRSPPRTIEDWCVAAAGSWVVALDNLSRFDERLTDWLCRAVSGDALVRRMLYTDANVSVVAFRRPVILTSIDPGGLRGDLSERLLPVELRRIAPKGRLTEESLLAMFAAERPRLLGGLLDLLARVLGALAEVDVDEPPRMADFARVVAALDAVLGTDTLGAYRRRVRQTVADVVEADLVAGAVSRLMANRALVWEGTPEDLLLALEKRIDAGSPPRGWPTSAAALGKRLKNLAPALREVGVEFEVVRKSSGRTYLLRRPVPDETAPQ